MATVNCNIVGYKRGTIVTDKGNYDFIINVIDQPITNGNRYNILNYSDIYDKQYPTTAGVCGTHKTNNGTTRNIYTQFTSWNGKITFKKNVEDNYYYLRYFELDGNVLAHEARKYVSENYVLASRDIFEGSNGVIWHHISLDLIANNVFMDMTGYDYQLESNTTDSFGSWVSDKGYPLTTWFQTTTESMHVSEILQVTAVYGNFNPYEPGGYSGPGGGSGDYDNTSDPVPVPSLPTISGISSGMLTAYVPNSSDLQALASYMWSSSFDLDALKKIFANPIDCILGMSIVPCPISTTTSTLYVGGIDTGLSMPKTTQQFVEVDCGTKNLKEYWGNFMDYDPYTKIEIYLPFIGTHALNADDVVDHTIGVKYHIDILTGACIAYITSDSNVIYSFIGQCAISIPITGNDWTNVLNGALNIAGSVGTMVAVGEISAPLAVATAGNVASAGLESNKQNIEKSGSLSGAGGLMGILKPYLIITRPRQCVPESQEKYTGYASNITSRLGDLNGFTVVSDIRLDKIPGTDTEVEELLAILKEGVIL